MISDTLAHATILTNLATAVGERLRGTQCRSFSNVRIETGCGRRYPDGVITCGQIINLDTTAANPVIVFEITSRITGSEDRITKSLEYAAIPSIRRFVLIDQEVIGAVMFARNGGEWRGQVIADNDTLSLPEISLAFPLSDLYVGLNLSES